MGNANVYCGPALEPTPIFVLTATGACLLACLLASPPSVPPQNCVEIPFPFPTIVSMYMQKTPPAHKASQNQSSENAARIMR